MFHNALVVLVVALAAGPPEGGLDGARRLWQNGRYAEAQEAYEEVLKKPGDLAPALRARGALGLADCLASQGEPEKAIEAVKKALEAQPEAPDLWAKLAEIQFGRGDWDGAAAAARRALKAD